MNVCPLPARCSGVAESLPLNFNMYGASSFRTQFYSQQRLTQSLSNKPFYPIQMNVSIRASCRNFASRRLLSTTSHLRAPPLFGAGPAPPRLPEEEQKLYEQLQRSSTGAFSTPRPTVVVNQSPATSQSQPTRPQINQSPHAEPNSAAVSEREVAAVDARVRATGDGEELHPDIRRGVQPEFEGEKNPKTGEIGGPKNEPLRWGGDVDWSYNGRVTDF